MIRIYAQTLFNFVHLNRTPTSNRDEISYKDVNYAFQHLNRLVKDALNIIERGHVIVYGYRKVHNILSFIKEKKGSSNYIELSN